MKLFAAGLLLLIVISSCKKNTSDNNQPVSTVAVSVHFSDPDQHQFDLDSFVRDDKKRLSKLIYIGVDSTVVPAKTYTFEYDFNYTGNDSLPTSYTAMSTDNHKLQYDNQRRIIMDSSMQIHNTFYFSYTPSGTILYQDLPSNIGHYIDTMKVNNGNIASRSYWYFEPYSTQHINFAYTYSSLANPLSFSAIDIGLLLLEITGRRDYLSKNLWSQAVNDLFPETDNSSWTTDKYGRVVSGQQTLSVAGKVTRRYITYIY
jgi:hypothetical protein